MHPLIVASGIAVWIAARIAARRWIVNRWLDDRITDRQAGLLFGLVSFAPLTVVATIAVAMRPGAAPILVLGILPAAIIIFGLLGAVMDYMAANGIKESLKRARDIRRSQ